MNLKNNQSGLRITENDRQFVRECFDWLLKCYGYPGSHHLQYVFDAEFFPSSFSGSQILPHLLLDDLCHLLMLDKNSIEIKIEKDLRDSSDVPLLYQGEPLDSDLLLEENRFIIILSNSSLNYPGRVLHNLIIEAIKISCENEKLNYEAEGVTDLLLYFIAIFKGFGVILANLLRETYVEQDMFWKKTRNYVSPMPGPVMAHALASYATMLDLKEPSWKKYLPSEMRSDFEHSMKFLCQSGDSFYNKRELDAANLFHQGGLQYLQNDFETAIETYQKALFLTNDNQLRAVIYHSIGYTQMRMGEYEKSIASYRKTQEIDDGVLYLFDNLGHSLIMTGKLEEGKRCVEKAMAIERNEISYSYRNLALYYMFKGDIENCERHFQLSFASEKNMPVDLLEYHYARFKWSIGEKQDALKNLEIAISKNEPEAIKWKKELEAGGNEL